MRKEETYLAKTFQGMEDILSDELKNIGAKNIKTRKRAVLFDADVLTFYKAIYWSRTALRILKPITSFRAASHDFLYQKIREIDWTAIFHFDQSFAISSVVKSSTFKHSHYTSLKVKDAVVDQFRDRYNKRPFVETNQPDIRIHVHINDKKVSVYLDAAGESLHKRGYRQDATFPAPLSECLAAGFLLHAGWDGQSHFIDPMCGSGTLLIEAGMIARNIPAQRFRKYFSFHNWNDFNARLWRKMKSDATTQERSFDYTISGYDNNQDALKATRENLRGAGLKAYTDVRFRDFEELQTKHKKGFLIMNPPYDDTIKVDDVFLFYEKMGDSLKNNFKGWEAWVFSANIPALKKIGLKTSKRIPLFNGPNEGRLCLYELF